MGSHPGHTGSMCEDVAADMSAGLMHCNWGCREADGEEGAQESVQGRGVEMAG